MSGAKQGAVLIAASGLVALSLVAPALRSTARADALTLCGNPGPASPIQHVVVVMLENESAQNVIGNVAAPYINGTLMQQCGSASQMFGATHYSAANYLALTAGAYPAGSPAGCGSVAMCHTPADNLFHQTETHGQSWKAYEEAMPSACAKTSSGSYSLGHNPALFYDDLADCAAYDVPVAALNVPSGALWGDLENRTLPSFSFVTPDDIDNGHDSGTGVPAIDSFLSTFIPLVAQSNSYQDGQTAVFVTFDEGRGGTSGQDCTNQALDLAGSQESCHIPFFVVDPYTQAGPVAGFFDHYSVTRSVEEILGLPLLGNAAQAPSLVTPFGLGPQPSASPTPTLSPSMTPTPSPTATDSPTPAPTDSMTPSPSMTPTDSPTPSVSPSPSTSPLSHEYVINRGFEGGSAAGWTGVYTAKTVSAPTQVTAATGFWSLAVASSANTASVGVTSKPAVIGLAAAQTSLFGSVWVRSATSGLAVTQMVREKTAGGATVGYQTRSISLADTAWHRITAPTPYVVKTSGDTVWFTVYTKNLPPGGVLYADDFSLTSPG